MNADLTTFKSCQICFLSFFNDLSGGIELLTCTRGRRTVSPQTPKCFSAVFTPAGLPSTKHKTGKINQAKMRFLRGFKIII